MPDVSPIPGLAQAGSALPANLVQGVTAVDSSRDALIARVQELERA